ncbi:MAG: type II secretion system F family protein [Patescibacteria group bacterium]
MARFSYVAQNSENEISKGVIEAPTHSEAVRVLVRKGLSPIKLEVFKDAGEKNKTLPITISFRKNLTLFDQINILRHLGTILNTGTDLLSGLDIIAKDAINPLVQKILYDVKERVGRGERFSDAIEKWKSQFSPIFVSLVRAGESSGTLPKTLISYAQELRKDYSFFRKLRSAVTYPVILVVAVVAMILILISIVVPRLKQLFSTTRAAPPFYTKFFIAVSDFWLAHLWTILGILAICAVALMIAFRKKTLREKLMEILWYFPVLKKINRNLILSRFTKTIANLIDAGFSLKEALHTTEEVVGPKHRKALKEIAEAKLAKGVEFSEALKSYEDLFPRILVSVIATGEKSGQLSSVLLQMGEFYEEEVLYSLELFLTLIEPLLLVFVGLVVGLMAASIISPIYSLIGHF